MTRMAGNGSIVSGAGIWRDRQPQSGMIKGKYDGRMRMAEKKDDRSLFEQRISMIQETSERGDVSIEPMGEGRTGRLMIKEAGKAVREHISHQPHVQRVFSFMPTMMTRVSPFHFRNRKQLKDWPLVRLDSEDRQSWGRMTVTGELLVIFDETVLFSLLALMKKHRNDAFETNLDEICILSNIVPSAGNYNAVWRSVQRLAGTRIDMELSKGSGRKKRPVQRMTGSILGYADMDPERNGVRVVFNPYFLEMYGESFVTNIDIMFRSGLKKDVSKACYRFLQGQLEKEIDVSLPNLSVAINLDLQKDASAVRRKVREGLRELEEKGYLSSFSLAKKDEHIVVAKTGHQLLSSDGKLLPW